MKNFKLFCLLVIAITIFLSCKKDNSSVESLEILDNSSEHHKLKEEFSLVLAKVMNNDVSVRRFLKSEAIKQFDNDNDVLIFMIKDNIISEGESFYDKMSKYGFSRENFDLLINVFPTLTIMVPEIPNFSPESWDVHSEVPMVAIDPKNRNQDVIAYDSEGKILNIPYNMVPGFPIIVLKENERVNVKVNGFDKSPKSSALLSSGKVQQSFFKQNGIEFSFSNEAFNGFKKPQKVNNNVKSIIPVGSLNIDNSIVQAFNNQVEWQRDYIYYGINPSTGENRGVFKNNYKEFITGIKMNFMDYEKIGDQTADPIPTKADYYYFGHRGGSRPLPQAERWTDGYFDIRVNILINSNNGIGQVLNKVFTISPSSLFDVDYVQAPNSSRFYYVGVKPRQVVLNEPIDGWNLESYGNAWKFTVSEYDLSEEITIVKTHKSTFGTNFEINASTGEKVKVGAKFGTNSTTEETASYSYKSTASSDDLGEGILNFGDPIITGIVMIPNARGDLFQNYNIWDVTTGSAILTVMPKKVY